MPEPEPELPQVDFRTVEAGTGMRPSVYINSRVPKDITDVSSAEDIEAIVSGLGYAQSLL